MTDAQTSMFSRSNSGSAVYWPDCGACMGVLATRVVSVTNETEPHHLHAERFPELQDVRDGAALRLLREALPDGWGMLVEAEVTWWRVEVRQRHRMLYAIETGATIAEAADKCREVLP